MSTKKSEATEQEITTAWERGQTFACDKITYHLYLDCEKDPDAIVVAVKDRVAKEREQSRIGGVVEGLRMMGVPTVVTNMVGSCRSVEEITRLLTAFNAGKAEAEKPVDPPLPYGVSMTDAEKSMTKAGQKIEAIKAVRARTNLGLKEAKDVVDAFSDHLRQAA